MSKGVKTGGRTKGTPNKITAAFKDAVKTVYEDIGGNGAFAAWAKDNPGEFYRIAARLIPTEVNMNATAGLTVVLDRSCGGSVTIEGERHWVNDDGTSNARLLPN